jgi:hypothetical protein
MHNTEWLESQLTQKAFENVDANIKLCQPICRMVLQRCDLCTEHEESHFNFFFRKFRK